MAPERLNGEVYSASSDLWSLGMILIECAQGQHPWTHAQSYYDLVVGVSECDQPPRLPPGDVRFSADLCDMSAACLTKQPNERPTSRSLMTHPFVLRGLQLSAVAPSGGGDDACSCESGVGDGGDVTAAVVQVGEAAGDTLSEEQCTAAAAHVLGTWLASTFGVEYQGVAHGAHGALDAAAAAEGVGASMEPSPAVEGRRAREMMEREGRSASRIQAWLRGQQVRKELEEMRVLEEELGELVEPVTIG